MKDLQYSLAELARQAEAEVKGDPACVITGIATIDRAGPGDITFLANPKYRKYLSGCQASAVILHPEQAENFSGNAIVADNPYLAYATLSHCFDRKPRRSPGIHPSAVIADSAEIGAEVFVGPNVVIEAGAVIGNRCEIGSGCYIGANSQLGDDSLLFANVTIYHGISIGRRSIIHAGAVIGSDGFGFANHQGHWHKIAQVGGVRIGDDVEIGAGTTIDRGAIDDTVIGHNVIIDNQVQIAHNVVIGDHSAFAGVSAVAGSTRIGRYCMIGGAVAVLGHLEICDHVQVSAMSLVTKSITRPGVYSSGTGFSEHNQWRRNVARFRHLDELAKRVAELEKQLASK